jgi:hypothetical protein
MTRTARGLVIDTIGDLIDEGHELMVYCYNTSCRHGASVDLEALTAKLGRDHGSMHADLAHKFRCSKCGGRNVGFKLHPPTGTAR